MSHKHTATWPDMKAGDKPFSRAGKILLKIFHQKNAFMNQVHMIKTRSNLQAFLQ